MLNFIVFVYEVFRFLLLFLSLLAAETPAGAGFPPVLYASAVSLFPIMAFFLWLDGRKYRPFLYLYTAGKVISTAALSVPVFSALGSVFILTPESLASALLAPCIALLDLLTLIRAAFSLRAKKKADSPPPDGM
jgi:hypothetical protein